MKRRTVISLSIAAILLAATVQGLYSSTPASAIGPIPPVFAESDVCPLSAPARTFDVFAVQVPISYNHWGDFDPQGRLFVLESQLNDLLDQVSTNLAAAGLETVQTAPEDFFKAVNGSISDPTPFHTVRRIQGAASVDRFDVSPLVQPLVVRAHMGDCVRFNLTNLLPEPVSIHVHRATESPGGGMALGRNTPDLTLPTETRTYSVFIPNTAGMEGAHFLHSHADHRYQTKHGLFGALVAEPTGSSWKNQDGTPSLSGQDAIIVRPGVGVSDFREYVVIYHDEVELLDSTLHPLPVVSPFGEYGPGTKAINFRSEPFYDRFKFHDDLHELYGELPRGHDKSQGYGSYTYGDPAHFIPKAYVGDPSKFRLVNAGPGQTHIHHLHGGGDRWRASPVGDNTQFDIGLTKSNNITLSKSERIDVQMMSPGESFNAEIEGGAGGVQQSVGDFLYHCHIAEHYVGGMFSFWRVYNTLQPGLAELPDRPGGTPNATNSAGLIGKNYTGFGTVNASNLDEWVEPQLPVQGEPLDDEATVWSWAVNGTTYYGENETEFVWPNYKSATPGVRPELKFNPNNGRLSYPHLSPHLGKRPPFAPGHGPAPYLGETVSAARPDGLCPASAPIRDYKVVATNATVKYNTHVNKDTAGEVFVHAVDKDAVVDGKNPKSFVIRANQGDCVDITFASRLKDTADNDEHSKVNMHIHLVQFDVQGSDGVITGLNYETSIRPATSTGTALSEKANAGNTTIKVTDGSKIRNLTWIGISLTEDNVELRKIVGKSGNTIILDAALGKNHTKDELVGSEFVRYRWYADVDLGIVYWHDHVDGLNAWRHGLFASLIVEPAGSEWRDPKNHSAPQVQDGHVVDIIGDNGTFRELVLHFQEKSAITAATAAPPANNCALASDQCLSSFNLRSEPFVRRAALGSNPLNETANGNISTDVLRAYPGDNVTIRLLYTGQSDSRSVNTFALTGHRFPFERNNTGSRLIDSQSFAISSHHNLKVECGAGGCSKLPGDYLYYITQPSTFRMGAWGILRVHDTVQGDLEELPTNDNWSVGTLPNATVRKYDVSVISKEVAYNSDPIQGDKATLKMFVLEEDRLAVQNGLIRPMPLVLRARAGEIIEVNLTNRLPAGTEKVTIHSSLLEASPKSGLGIPVGKNPDKSVGVGGSQTFRWYARSELGVTYLTSFGRPQLNQDLSGLYGALVIEPANSNASAWTGMSATITRSDNTTFREHVLLYGSNDPTFMSGIMPYNQDVGFGPIANPPPNLIPGVNNLHVVKPPIVNYRTESLPRRAGGQPGQPGQNTIPGGFIGGMGIHVCTIESNECLSGVATPPDTFEVDAVFPGTFEVRSAANSLLQSSLLFGDPETPILDATEGQSLVVRAVGGGGDQVQSHHVSGHTWRMDPGATAATNVVDTITLGQREGFNAWMTAGPGGAGDYLYGTHRGAFEEGGAWGILRVS